MEIDGECGVGTIDVEYERQLFDLRQLLEISKSLNSTLDYSTLIDSILYTCMAQMKVFRAALFAKKSLDSAGFSLRRNYMGYDLDRGDDFAIPEDHELVGLLCGEERCLTMPELRARLDDLAGLEALLRLDPSLIVPLKAKGAIVGIIALGERAGKRGFDRYEREYALDIAVFASIAIHNASLFEMTTTDMMTKLKMKHYFHAVLEERLSRAAASASPLCLIMIDIDHFKKFNDTYGHTCGDDVIRNVSRAIRESVREEDVAARYGGEEFAVLLCRTEIDDARLVAERMRRSVEAMRTGCEGLDLNVTVSSGLARFDPRRDKDAKDFIDRADRALYKSKQSGRNRVTMAD